MTDLLPYSEHTFYLSGPMTGLPNYNYEAFERITHALRIDGYQVLSPHENPKHPEHLYLEEDRWRWYMDLDRKLVEQSTAIILMQGWPYSSGARHELEWSIELHHDVFYFYEGTPYTIFPMTLEGHYGTQFTVKSGTEEIQEA